MDAATMLGNLKNGTNTPQQLVSEAINKIQEVNPRINAATEMLKDEAILQLSSLANGPLKGLPFSIKECYAIAGKTITSASKRMPPIYCDADAAVLQKLKAAGAIPVARGNTSEFLLGRETENLLHGTTNNVFDPTLTSGGSSGGDGTIVASNCVAFGIGTDIGGSCRFPALFNGIVGFKPASGQIDKTGIFPKAGNDFVETLNSPGILARSVRDARMIYNIIADKQLNTNNTQNAQILTSSGFDVSIKDASIQNALNASIQFFKNNYTVKDIAIPESGKLYTDFAVFMCAGFTDKIYEWSVTKEGQKLSFIGELMRRLQGKPTLSHELFSMLLPFNLLNSQKKLHKTIHKVAALREKYNSVLGKSILVLPTAGILAPPHKKFISQYNKPGIIRIITPVSFCNILNLSCITIPAWKYQKHKNINPPGIQLACVAGNEELLLNTAEKLEKELN